ncbi:hypothetical protein AB1Y20_022259 [Prymnesium parvum]|uniref:Uncharacterized protein n=1 Tax=Prymnesium parvum TaxID=97485 RepID=A0AB34JIF5_PRYPA
MEFGWQHGGQLPWPFHTEPSQEFEHLTACSQVYLVSLHALVDAFAGGMSANRSLIVIEPAARAYVKRSLTYASGRHLAGGFGFLSLARTPMDATVPPLQPWWCMATFEEIIAIIKSQVHVKGIRLRIKASFFGVEWAASQEQETFR